MRFSARSDIRLVSNFLSLDEPADPWEFVRQSLGGAVLVSGLALAVGILPGHSDPGFWPLYVPEHYGTRNSQHLFDPYR